ncbi:hypothetical protein H0H92_005088, partial [Tricholoma furcatifolium]
MSSLGQQYILYSSASSSIGVSLGSLEFKFSYTSLGINPKTQSIFEHWPAQWAIVGIAEAITLITERIVGIVWAAGTAACDVIIASVMTYILYMKKTPLQFKRTQNLMNRLIAQSIESGTITAVAAIIQLVFFLTKPENFLYASV